MGSYNILTRLSKKHKITILTYIKGQTRFKNIKINGFNLGETTGFGRGFIFILLSLINGFYTLIRDKPELIYAKNLTSPGIIGLTLSKISRVPLVLHTSGPDIQAPLINVRMLGKFGLLFKLIIHKILKLEIRNASVIIANCIEDEINISKFTNQKKSILIYNGVNFLKFKPISDQSKSEKRRKLNINNESFVVCTVAKPRKEKRLDLIFSTAEKINAFFLLLGPSESDISSSISIPANCILLGFKSNVNEYLEISDAFLLTSEGEGLSNAMLEALSTGLPVISTNVGEAKHIIEVNKLGFIADTNKERITFINRLINEPSLRLKYKENSRKYITENHSWDDTVFLVEKLFNKVIN